jgi:hypothetical protein
VRRDRGQVVGEPDHADPQVVRPQVGREFDRYGHRDLASRQVVSADADDAGRALEVDEHPGAVIVPAERYQARVGRRRVWRDLSAGPGRQAVGRAWVALDPPGAGPVSGLPGGRRRVVVRRCHVQHQSRVHQDRGVDRWQRSLGGGEFRGQQPQRAVDEPGAAKVRR